MSALITIVIMLLTASSAAEAHGDEIHLAHSVWTFDPWIVVPLFLSAALYGRGVLRLWSRASESRKMVQWRAAAFAVGWLALAGALVSPLHWLGERLLTFHMIEHEILMAISAPLMVIARPIGPLLWGLPKRLRSLTAKMMKTAPAQAAWKWTSGGTTSTLLHGLAIWVWHAPVFFDAAVANVAVHRLQHLSFFATALLFWWSVFWRSDRGVAAWHLFITMLHTSILGALMTLAPRFLYIARGDFVEGWGLTPLEDQQLAGLVMWIPAGTIYAGAALTLAAVWVATSARGSGHAEQVNHS